jgi:hypothetical protein
MARLSEAQLSELPPQERYQELTKALKRRSLKKAMALLNGFKFHDYSDEQILGLANIAMPQLQVRSDNAEFWNGLVEQIFSYKKNYALTPASPYTLLMTAAFVGRVDWVKQLLPHCDPEVREQYQNMNASDFARKGGYVSIAEYIDGADSISKCNNGFVKL